MTKQSRITSMRALLRFFRETGVRYEKRHGGHICV